MNKYNTVIIGGGASGLAAAILLARKIGGENVLIIESLDRVGKKLITTGNGRCNITNRYINENAYHGENAQFCYYALNKYGFNFTKEFFESLGILLTEGENGKMYPLSLQASSVVDALRFALAELGVTVICNERVTKVIKNKEYCLYTDNILYKCDNVIFACGGLAAGIKYGCDSCGYKMLENLGLKRIKATPSIVQVKTDITPIKALKGIKVNALVTLFEEKNKVRSELGEILFTDYGISGPPVLQISRQINRNEKENFIKINLMPDFNYCELLDFLKARKELLSGRIAEQFFNGIFPKMLGHTILKICQIPMNHIVGDLNDKQCSLLADTIGAFTLKVTGTKGFDMAQVTAGGIDTGEFSERTMESNKYKGLYAIGEVLDIDGDCGGFNLQWAWSSAAVSVDSIVGGKK